MRILVRDAAREVEQYGLLERLRDYHPDKVIEHVGRVLRRELPADLIDFYREGIARIGDFPSFVPHWNAHVGWRTPDTAVTELLHADAMPLFDDGCGNLYGLDLTPDVEAPAVYFFDHERGYDTPQYAVGSSLGAFILLLADQDRAFDEGWTPRWELKIDPDLDTCPRAPAIWGRVEGSGGPAKAVEGLKDDSLSAGRAPAPAASAPGSGRRPFRRP